MGLFGRKDKEHPSGGESVRDLVAMAKQMQAAAVHQREAVQHASASVGGAAVGSTAWMRELAGILQGPQPGYVKRCTCTVCGAPKKLPSVTAYVYCDYCGSLVDFDLHRARVVCDGCGRSLDVGAAALACPGCGGAITLPVGASDAACPFCRTNVERVGVL